MKELLNKIILCNNYGMQSRNRVFVPSTSDLKILKTVKLLNDNKLYPLSLGVYKILSGSNESEYKEYSTYETFGTLLSYNSKHVSKLIMMLVRYEFLEKKFDPVTEDLYLKITGKGEKTLFDYDKKHKYLFKQKSTIKKPTIVKISD